MLNIEKSWWNSPKTYCRKFFLRIIWPDYISYNFNSFFILISFCFIRIQIMEWRFFVLITIRSSKINCKWKSHIPSLL